MIRFDHFVEACLYGPDGFYTSGAGIAGRRGDFITSPEVGPLFGAVLARQIDAWWDDLGQPDDFVVVDAGTGPGTLLRSLELAAPPCAAAWHLLGVDRATGVELPDDLGNAVVIANELLDNLAFRVVGRDEHGAWYEVYVEDGPGGTVSERTQPIEDPGLTVAPGQRAPWQQQATAWVADVQRRGARRLLAFDYGAPTTAELASRGGWLRTYRDHQRGDDPLVEPGSWDITSDVAFDQLPTTHSLVTQADWLRDNGIDALVEEGRSAWKSAAARPDLAAMRMRSRVNEAAALSDPSGLGAWLVGEWHLSP